MSSKCGPYLEAAAEDNDDHNKVQAPSQEAVRIVHQQQQQMKKNSSDGRSTEGRMIAEMDSDK